jgi:N-acetylneuraminic acid mutarotase
MITPHRALLLGLSLSLAAYDPATNSWSTKASLPSKQQYAAGAAFSGKLYVAGGANFDVLGVPAYSTVMAYDPTTNTRSAKAGMLTPRYYAAGVNAGSKLWVISGWGAGGNSSKNEAYTP